eukprot:9726578-Lingulodinium_polyedra.AAC.1
MRSQLHSQTQRARARNVIPINGSGKRNANAMTRPYVANDSMRTRRRKPAAARGATGAAWALV